MSTNRRGAAVPDPTFGNIMRSTLIFCRCGSQKMLLFQDGLRQGYASKRQAYEFCRNCCDGTHKLAALNPYPCRTRRCNLLILWRRLQPAFRGWTHKVAASSG